MANYTYSQYTASPFSISVGDTISFNDGSRATFVNNAYHYWEFDTPPQTIMATASINTTSFMAGLTIGIEHLNNLKNSNGKCTLHLLANHYIEGYTHPQSDITVMIVREGVFPYSYTASIFYEDPLPTILAQMNTILSQARMFIANSACFKTKTTCCLEALCDPDNYVLI